MPIATENGLGAAVNQDLNKEGLVREGSMPTGEGVELFWYGTERSCEKVLRGLGHDALNLAELGLHDLPDGAVLEKAGADDRIVVTHNLVRVRFLVVGEIPASTLTQHGTLTP